MTALTPFSPTDRLLALTFTTLAIATLVLATQAHMLCDIFCLHGEAMIASEICSGRA